MIDIYIFIAIALVIGVVIGATIVVSLGSHRDSLGGTDDRLALGARRLTGLHACGLDPAHKADLRDHDTLPL